MDMTQVLDVLKLNRLLYPNSFIKEPTTAEVEQLAKVWLFYFGGMDGDNVKRAFLNAAKRSKYAIQPSDIFDELNAQTDDATTAEQWQMLVDALPKAEKYLNWRKYRMVVGVDDNGRPIYSDGRRELQDLFDSLPAAIRREIGNADGLREFLSMSASELQFRYSAFERRMKEERGTHTLMINEKERKMLNGQV